MQYVKLIVDRGPMEKIAKAVPAYEVPLLVAQYGPAAIHVETDDVDVQGFRRTAAEEFNRLRSVYPGDEETGGAPYIDVVFGRFGKRQFQSLFSDAAHGEVDVSDFLGEALDAADETEAEGPGQEESEPEEGIDSLEDLTKDELKRLAADREIAIPSNASKAQIIEALDAADETEAA